MIYAASQHFKLQKKDIQTQFTRLTTQKLLKGKR